MASTLIALNQNKKPEGYYLDMSYNALTSALIIDLGFGFFKFLIMKNPKFFALQSLYKASLTVASLIERSLCNDILQEKGIKYYAESLGIKTETLKAIICGSTGGFIKYGLRLEGIIGGLSYDNIGMTLVGMLDNIIYERVKIGRWLPKDGEICEISYKNAGYNIGFEALSIEFGLMSIRKIIGLKDIDITNFYTLPVLAGLIDFKVMLNYPKDCEKRDQDIINLYLLEKESEVETIYDL